MNIVFKVSDNVKEKMIRYYTDKKKENKPPYSVFQALEEDTVITLYESGKVMFQGLSADIDANLWIDMEKHLNNRTITINDKKEEKEKSSVNFFNESTIGSDEVGTGDYFGPIVVSAAYVSKENSHFLIDLGVKDSKKLTDDKIKKIAPEIIKKIPYSTIVLSNQKYNENYSAEVNMNKIKAILHNKALLNLLKKENISYQKIVVDQFVYPKKYYEHIANCQEKVKNITFITKAEDKCLSVAAASIISRYMFLGKIKELEDNLKLPLPKGAGEVVDQAGCEIIKKYGFNILAQIAKLNFKNTDKIKATLQK